MPLSALRIKYDNELNNLLKRQSKIGDYDDKLGFKNDIERIIEYNNRGYYNINKYIQEIGYDIECLEMSRKVDFYGIELEYESD